MRKTLMRTWRRAWPGGAPCDGMTARVNEAAGSASGFGARGARLTDSRCAGAASRTSRGVGRKSERPMQCAHEIAGALKTRPLSTASTVVAACSVASCDAPCCESASSADSVRDIGHDPPLLVSPRQQSGISLTAEEAAALPACGHKADASTPLQPLSRSAATMPVMKRKRRIKS